MKYLIKRLTQPSTWLGVGAVGTALVASGGVVNPSVVVALLTALGLVHIDESGV